MSTSASADYVRADDGASCPQAPVTAHIIRGDARCLPLADNSVDLIVTSPPYFALRSYQDGGEHYDGQIGAEPTPAEFVDALIACTREWMRVLKPSGSIWVNLGDKYAGVGGSNGHAWCIESDSTVERRARVRTPLHKGRTAGGVRGKSLFGIPWRYALRCIDDLGLILRAEVIWSKPNGLPESVTDRVRRSHEQWFHFTREPRYFSAVDEIREEFQTGARADQGGLHRGTYSPLERMDGAARRGFTSLNPLGKLPGSVWTVATEPLSVPEVLGVDHFAAFPSEWPRRIIQGWSPAGVCVECGEGRRPVLRREFHGEYDDAEAQRQRQRAVIGGGADRVTLHRTDAVRREITGYTCDCPEPTAQTRPAVVLDPFGGTGTTALVASVLGRLGVTVDLSNDYCRLARWRTSDPGERARAMRVEKPPKQIDGQFDLFGAAS